jgi:ribosomal protein L29
MAILKKSELRAMDGASLRKKLSEVEAEINSNRGAIRSSGKPNNSKFRELRRLRASILTRLGAIAGERDKKA